MKNLSWYFNRLKLMTFAEVFSRFGSVINSKKLLKYAHSSAPRMITGLWIELDKKVNHNDCAARQFLNHKIRLFALENCYLGERINWHYDYKDNKQASISFFKDIDYRDFQSVGDIKYIWEINRLQHQISLAKAYFLTSNEEYKREVIRQIDEWIEANPFLFGVNWSSSLEVAIRLIAWAWVWHFLGDIPDEMKGKWVNSIYHHCLYIDNCFSKYSSANNHLIGEAAGLFVASLVWQFERDSSGWQEKAFKVLSSEIEKQNYEDGVNKEQAISYQQFVLDFFIIAGLLGEKNGIKFPDHYWDKVRTMIGFIAALIDENGNVPHIGDEDDGFVLKLDDSPDFNPYRSLLATGAVLFGSSEFKAKSGCFDEKSFWLLGKKGLEQYNALEKKETIGRTQFPNAGYYVLADDKGVKCCFDCGPLGYLSLAAHGHADALSFTLNKKGNKFLVDSGTYAYHTNKEWRDYFKGTSAHNTVCVDRVDQSVSGGNFMWLKKANARLIKFDSNDKFDVVVGEHDGYKRLHDPVIHRRELRLDKEKNILIILDSMFARKKHLIEINFHLDVGCEVVPNGEATFIIHSKEEHLAITIDSKLKSHVFKGSLEPKYGWQSEHYDVKHATITLNASNEFIGSCEFETIISLN